MMVIFVLATPSPQHPPLPLTVNKKVSCTLGCLWSPLCTMFIKRANLFLLLSTSEAGAHLCPPIIPTIVPLTIAPHTPMHSPPLSLRGVCVGGGWGWWFGDFADGIWLASSQYGNDGTELPLKSITWVNVFIRGFLLKLTHQHDDGWRSLHQLPSTSEQPATESAKHNNHDSFLLSCYNAMLKTFLKNVLVLHRFGKTEISAIEPTVHLFDFV